MLTLEHVSKTFNPGTVNEKKPWTDWICIWKRASSLPSWVPTEPENHAVQCGCRSFYVDEGYISLEAGI